MVANRLAEIEGQLRTAPATWLVTGVAGFIGSHLLECLLRLDQRVVGLDSFVGGFRHNLAEIESLVSGSQWQRFHFVEADIRDLECVRRACAGVDYVLHQAALGSVPRSIEQPLAFNDTNVDGTLKVFVAARDAGVKRVVYASSSAVYGDHPGLPKVEAHIGRPLSPYAATKRFNEIYAEVLQRCYGLPLVGLRYFNVFGPRQNPDGAYAAVIPKWLAATFRGEPIQINGDGGTSRDFCYVANVVQANLLAAIQPLAGDAAPVFNIGGGRRTTLIELATKIRTVIASGPGAGRTADAVFGPERAGDVRHSLADISAARQTLGYEPTHDLARGLEITAAWHTARQRPSADLTAPQATS